MNDIINFYGANWCPDCQRTKSYLQDNHINYQYIEVDKYDWVAAKVEEINNSRRIILTILINGKSFSNRKNAVLKEALNIGVEKETKVYDTVIDGAGAAGLTASIYFQRDRFSSLILEKKNIGGNVFLTEKIENYSGFTNISGPKQKKKMNC